MAVSVQDFYTVCRVKDKVEIKAQYGHPLVALPVLEKLLGRENRLKESARMSASENR